MKLLGKMDTLGLSPTQQLDIGLPHKQTPDGSDQQSHLLYF